MGSDLETSQPVAVTAPAGHWAQFLYIIVNHEGDSEHLPQHREEGAQQQEAAAGAGGGEAGGAEEGVHEEIFPAEAQQSPSPHQQQLQQQHQLQQQQQLQQQLQQQHQLL